MALTVLLWLLISGVSEAIDQNAPCYTPNGTDRNVMFGYTQDPVYLPCNLSAAHSMCCAIGGQKKGWDSCMKENGVYNGLCQTPDNTRLVWRESCTDPTWQDPGCRRLFVNGTGLDLSEALTHTSDGNVTSDVPVTFCENGSWCFNYDNRECCVQGEGVYLNANGDQVAQNPNAVGSSKLSTGAAAGIGVGVAIAVCILIGILGFLLVRRRRKRKTASLPGEMSSAPILQGSDSLHHSGSQREESSVMTPQPYSELSYQSPSRPSEVSGLSPRSPEHLYYREYRAEMEGPIAEKDTDKAKKGEMLPELPSANI